MQSISEQLLVRYSVLALGDGVRSEGIHNGHLFPVPMLVAVLYVRPHLVPLPDNGFQQVGVLLVASDGSIGFSHLLRTTLSSRDFGIPHMGEPPIRL